LESERDRVERVLAERTRALAVPLEAATEQALRVVAFEVGAERYAITMDAVLRVERVGAIVRIPGAAADVIGVFSVDGRPCPLLDVPALLGAAAAGPARRWAIVLGRRVPEVALAADTVDLDQVVGARLDARRPPRLGTTADARVIMDGAALLPADVPRRTGDPT
jgi:chemotaxis signal transduction protein